MYKIKYIQKIIKISLDIVDIILYIVSVMKKNKFKPNKKQIEFFKDPRRIKLIAIRRKPGASHRRMIIKYIEKIIKEINEKANTIK